MVCPLQQRRGAAGGHAHRWPADGTLTLPSPAGGEGEKGKPDAVEVVRPIVAGGPGEAVGTMRSADKALQVRIRAVMGKGAAVGVEFVLTNVSPKPLANVRLTAYSNLEANHDHENDYGALDAAMGRSWPSTGRPACARPWRASSRPRRASPARGRRATRFARPPANRSTSGRPSRRAEGREAGDGERPAASGIYAEYAPAPPLEPKEPETRSLSEAEAAAALERDWIFQAEEKPLEPRAAEEIRWARDLAARIAKGPKAPTSRPSSPTWPPPRKAWRG